MCETGMSGEGRGARLWQERQDGSMKEKDVLDCSVRVYIPCGNLGLYDMNY